MKWLFSSCLAVLVFLVLPSTSQAASGIPLTPYQTKPVGVGERVAWIDPHGSDVFGNGSLAKPFATPAYAAERIGPGGIVLVNDGVYSVFGRLHTSGTEAAPITIRPAPDAHPIFSLIDANDGLQIAASHLQIEGLEFTHNLLAHRGSCLSIRADVVDVVLKNLDVYECARGLDVGGWSFSWGKLSDLSFHDLTGPAIECGDGACIDQNWQRLSVERIDSAATSTATIRLGERSRHVLIDGLTMQGVQGSGVEAHIPSIGIANGLFEGVEGTAVSLFKGGTISNSWIQAESIGLQATVNNDLTMRGNLVMAAAPQAHPFVLQASADTDATVLLEKNRIQINEPVWTLLPFQTKARLSFWRNGFFFPDEAATVSLFGQTLSQSAFAQASGTRIENGGDQMIGSGLISDENLFSPLIAGGRVELGDADSTEDTRVIYAGTPLKGKGSPVFLFGQDSRLHWVPRLDVLESWLPKATSIEEVPQATIDGIERGETLTYRPGSVLLRADNDAAVYAITAQQQVQWLTSEALARETYGPRWEKLIRVLSPQEWAEYRRESPLLVPSEVPSLDQQAQMVDPSDSF